MAANKISYHYALGVDPEFAGTADLRDALLASYPGLEWFGAPVVGKHRDDTAPAWGWLNTLLRTRTDWHPAVGIALQHAARDGGDHARTALADFLECHQSAVVLLDWVEPLATLWPDAKAIHGGTSLGFPDFRLATIVAGQRTLSTVMQDPEVSVEGIGPHGQYLNAVVQVAGDLEVFLARSAKRGDQSDGGGPWSWLLSEVMFRPQMRPWIPGLCATFAAGSDVEVRAMLDWFAEDHDLWRYVELLEEWQRTPPPWWDAPAGTRPSRWRHPLRNYADADTLGGVAVAALSRAYAQRGTPPVLDLAPLYGGPVQAR